VCQDFLIIDVSQSHSDIPRSVGLLWNNDQLVVATPTWQHTQHSQETNTHATAFIRARKHSNRAAAVPLLRLGGHWDKQCSCLLTEMKGLLRDARCNTCSFNKHGYIDVPSIRRTTVMSEYQWTWVEYKLVLYKPLSFVNFVRAREWKLLMWCPNRNNAINTEKSRIEAKRSSLGSMNWLYGKHELLNYISGKNTFDIYIILLLITLESCSKHVCYTVVYGTRGLLKLIAYLETLLQYCEWSNYNRLHDWNLYCWCAGWMFRNRLLFHYTELYVKAFE
jgi:hypothetical protein